ncbi:ejaculatory bulb-specific protein 3-like [Cydia fagiglandana]|uniref:ejaculatory bulb-specific protein 3-like n=1 Tax=Cydia fagiglandana TaxID=1458189 RepID=UPI002FEE49EE
MKLFIALATLVVLVAGQDTYKLEKEELDIDEVVSNPELLNSWFSCFVDQGPCNQLQARLKVDLPEGIQQACAKCTAPQKVIFKTFFTGLQEKAPADFEVFRQKFDPENKYFGPLAKAVA